MAVTYLQDQDLYFNELFPMDDDLNIWFGPVVEQIVGVKKLLITRSFIWGPKIRFVNSPPASFGAGGKLSPNQEVTFITTVLQMTANLANHLA